MSLHGRSLMAKATLCKQGLVSTPFRMEVLPKAVFLPHKYVITNEARNMCQDSSNGALGESTVPLSAEFYQVIRNLHVIYEIFTAVTMKNAVFCDVTSCGSCKNQSFGGT
jgi:hypothetical protein